MGTHLLSTRVAIIGAGNVGATCAYALLLRKLISLDSPCPKMGDFETKMRDISDECE